MSREAESNLISQLERAYALQKKARARAEQHLEDKSRELYAKNTSLQEAYEQLTQQQAQLVTQEKLASIGQLGASLAHELNNPNAFIQNNLLTLQDYVKHLCEGLDQSLRLANQLAAKQPPEEAAKLAVQLRTIRQNADLDFIQEDLPSLISESLMGTQRISIIANSLRYFADPDHSKRRDLDANECIEQALSLVRSKDKLADIQLNLERLPTISGLPMLLSQAIACLIQNGIEAQPDNPIVVVSSRAEEQAIVIDVQDNGPGLDLDNQTQLFEAFYSTKDGQNGLGLGIAKHIVEQHQGKVFFTASPQDGAMIRVELPLV